jgi:hypothetical protein
MNLSSRMEQFQVSFGMSDVYIIFMTAQHLARILKSVLPTSLPSKPLSKILATVDCDRLDIKWNLTADVCLRIHLFPLKALVQENLIQLDVEEAGASILVDATAHRYEPLSLVKEVYVQIQKNTTPKPEECPFSFFIKSRILHILVPNQYRLEFVFENMINFTKGMKELAIVYTDFSPATYCKEGQTTIEPSDIPVIKVSVEELLFLIQDDVFEQKLSQNYQHGCQEQLSRLARDRAFEKQVHLRNTADKIENK